jgi:hypothetical protein
MSAGARLPRARAAAPAGSGAAGAILGVGETRWARAARREPPRGGRRTCVTASWMRRTAPTTGPAPYDVYEVTPRKVLAFGTGEENVNGSTRYRF